MLSAQQIDQAAQLLVAARRSFTPGPCIPEAYRPTDTDGALAIQSRVLALLGEEIGGWKCGTPNPKTGPIVAAIPASAILRSLPCVVPGSKGLVEPEIAFVLGRDLPSRSAPYRDDEIRASIAESRLVVELITTRFADKPSATPPEILADAYNHHGLFIGPVIPAALDHPLEQLHATVTAAGVTLYDGVRPHPSGHPLKAFTWLVHFLTSRGDGLKAGQIVTTGSYAGIVEAPLGTPIHVQLADLGALNIELITGKP